MKYIDFDGVILDTEDILFEEWRKNPDRHLLPEEEKIKYIQNRDWEYIIKNSPEIRDSIYNLHNMDPKETTILTKIHSLRNEGLAKLKWKKENNIKQEIKLVYYIYKKTDIVIAKNNILIDDCLKNLDDWVNSGGHPVFFDKDDDNIDSWDEPNTKGYERVLSLSKFTKR